MSEHLLKLLLSDLKTLRIRCTKNKCGTVVEVEMDKLFSGHSVGACPTCGADFRRPQEAGVGGQLRQLVAAIGALGKMTDEVEIEFVLPEKGKP